MKCKKQYISCTPAIYTTIYIESLFVTNEALEIMYKPISVEMVCSVICWRLEKTKALRNTVFVHIRKQKKSLKHSVNENKEAR